MLDRAEILNRAIRYAVIAIQGSKRECMTSHATCRTYLDVLELPYSNKEGETRDKLYSYAKKLSINYDKIKTDKSNLAEFLDNNVKTHFSYWGYSAKDRVL